MSELELYFRATDLLDQLVECLAGLDVSVEDVPEWVAFALGLEQDEDLSVVP